MSEAINEAINEAVSEAVSDAMGARLSVRVLGYLATDPDASTAEITHAVAGPSFKRVVICLRRQRDRGLVRSTRGADGVERWTLTGQSPRKPVMPREEPWTPGRWVHPIRARALGLGACRASTTCAP